MKKKERKWRKMNTSSDAAESLVRIYLEGAEVGLRVTGSAMKNVAAALIALNKEQKFSTGKTKLAKMIRSGKELKVFTIRQEDLKKFTSESKNYGVLFCALRSKNMKSSDGLVDIMVRAEDASKVNRIIDRFNLSTPDVATIKREVQKDNAKENDIGVQKKSKESKIDDEIKEKPINKDQIENSNPHSAKTEKSPLSEHILTDKENSEAGSKSDKPSVKKELEKIKSEMDKQKDLDNSDSKEKHQKKNRVTKHKQPKKKKEKTR